MKKRLIPLLIALCFTFVACGNDDDDAINCDGFKPSQATNIFGIIRDEETRLPIRDATVRTIPVSENITTGICGEYEFFSLKPGPHQVMVKIPRYDFELEIGKFAFDGATPIEANLVLPSQELVVAPKTLNFLKNDTVREVTLGNRHPDRPLTWVIDAQGFEPWMEVAPLQGRVAEISAAVKVFVHHDKLPPGDPQLTTDFTIRSDGGNATVTVTVLNGGAQAPMLQLFNLRNGETIPDALVRVENGQTVHTDQDGKVQLRGLPQIGRVRLKISKDGYLPNSLELDTPIVADLAIRLKPLPRRRGNVFVGDQPFASPEQIAVDASAGRAYLTNAKSNVVSVIDIWGDTVMEAIPVNQGVRKGPKWVRGIAANPVRNEVYAANFWSGTVSVIDTLKGKAVDKIPVGDSPIALMPSADGRVLYLTRAPKDNGVVVVVDLISKQVIKNIPIGGEPSGIARKGDFLYVANSRQNTVFVIDIRRHAIHKVIPVGGNPIAVAASPKRNFVYVANSFADTVSVIDTRTQDVVGEPIPVGHEPRGIAVDASYDDGDVIYVTNHQDRSLSVIDIATRQVAERPITVGAFPIGVAVLAGGDKVYVVNSGSDDVSILGFE